MLLALPILFLGATSQFTGYVTSDLGFAQIGWLRDGDAVNFAVQATTGGWVGLGIQNPQIEQAMNGEVFIGKSGESLPLSHTATYTMTPVLNSGAGSYFTNGSVTSVDGKIIMKFTRTLASTLEPGSQPIAMPYEAVRMLVAISPLAFPAQHSDRQAITINLLATPNPTSAPPTLEPTTPAPTTDAPTPGPTHEPTTPAPTAPTTHEPTPGPTHEPTTPAPTAPTTDAPTSGPTHEPTLAPTNEPTAAPTRVGEVIAGYPKGLTTGPIKIGWERVGTNVRFAVQATTGGWLGLGIQDPGESTKMMGEAFIGRVDQSSVRSYTAVYATPPALNTGNGDYFANANLTVEGGVATMVFTRSLNGTGQTGSRAIPRPYSGVRIMTALCPTNFDDQHDFREEVVLDLSSPDDPTDEPTPAPTGKNVISDSSAMLVGVFAPTLLLSLFA